jgi:hypothetical protein
MDLKNSRISNLLFLLGASSVAIGGCEVNGTDDDGGGTSSTPTTGNNGTTEGPGETEGDETTGGASVGATGDSTGTPPGTDSGGSDDTAGTTGGTAGSACEVYAETYTYCTDKKMGAAVLAECEEYLAEVTGFGLDGCPEAFDDYYVCLSTLTCKEINMTSGCDAEFMAFDAACFPKG